MYEINFLTKIAFNRIKGKNLKIFNILSLFVNHKCLLLFFIKLVFNKY